MKTVRRSFYIEKNDHYTVNMIIVNHVKCNFMKFKKIKYIFERGIGLDRY